VPAGDATFENAWSDRVALPALLRAARKTYGAAIHAALADAGCDDVPRNGSFVLGGMARNGSPLADVVRALGVSKQAAGQLVDTLVLRGYLERVTDPHDRRRTVLTLTEHGKVAAAAARKAVERVDAQLEKRVGTTRLAHARATLGALVDMHAESEHSVSRGGGGRRTRA
jgi:DNA-binding MarR family transcriptional regulator